MTQRRTIPASQVVLVTGCSSGFGLLTAARLASHGHQVIATMRNLNKQGALQDELKRRGAQATILRLDVEDPASIRAVVTEIGDRYGYLDGLVNNAGVATGGFFEDLSEDEIRSVMNINFFGVQRVTRAALPLMRTQGYGKIINLSSISGRYGSPAFGAYTASKWALEGFSESLYFELRPFGIHVVLIEPGAYRTKIFSENARLATGFGDPQSPYAARSLFLKKKIDDHIQDNFRDPEDIAALIERVLQSPDPGLRYIPEWSSRCLTLLRGVLPFRLYAWIYETLLFRGLKES